MKALILGGTGTLGYELSRQLLKDENKVVCLSRCELKQKEMRSEFKNHPRLRFILGDIRDRNTLISACVGVDVVFHVAALKHVDTLEAFPEECVKTNVLGTINVADAAILAGVKHVVFSSTDKAVDPINVYGMSKGISERILLQRNQTQSVTKFSVFRWGNVVGSRGSVVGAFKKSLSDQKKIFLTDPEMTRFWIRIEDAVEFMLKKYSQAPCDRAIIPPIKAAPVTRLARAIANSLGIREYETVVTEIRPGEKIHESLISRHEVFSKESSTAAQYTIAELEDLVRDSLVSKWAS